MEPRAKLKGLFYGWYVVAGGWGVHVVVASTYVLGMGVLFTSIRTELEWTAAATAIAFSLRQFESGILSPFVGFFIDRWGTRKMMLAGLFILGLGFLLLARIQNLWQFYVVFLFLATGASIGYAQAMNTAVVNWFRRRRVRAMGFMWTGGSIGGQLVTLVALMVTNYGWRRAATISGLLVWAVGLPLATLMRHRPEPYGMLPDGDPPQVDATTPAAGTTARAPAAAPLESNLGVKEALKTRTFWVIAMAQATFATTSSMVLTVNLVPFLESIEFPLTQAASVVSLFMLAALPARVFLGLFGDRFEKRKVLAVLYVFSAAGTLILSGAQVYWHTIPFAILAGFAHGGAVIMTAVLVGESFGTSRFASINGLLHTFGVIGGVVGPTAGGLVYDLRGSYRPAFVAVAILVALAAPLILLAKRPQVAPAPSSASAERP